MAGKTRILVVEDETIVAMELQARLQALGYDVVGTAASGEDAIEKTGALHPDLVMMDIVIQGEMDGIETAGIIGERFDIPVVYLTAHSDDETLRRAKVTGPYGYVLKPFQERELHITIEVALHNYRIRKALEQARAYTESIVNTVREPLVVLDAEMRVRSANPSYHDTFRVTPEETENRLIYELGDRQWDIPQLRTALQQVLLLGTRIETFEVTREFPHVGRRTLLLNACQIKRDRGHGEPLILVAMWDITARVQAEGELREREQRFRALFERTNDAVFFFDLDGIYLAANQKAADMLGYTVDELVGASVKDIVSPHEHQDSRHRIDALLSGESLPVYERTLRKKMVSNSRSRSTSRWCMMRTTSRGTSRVLCVTSPSVAVWNSCGRSLCPQCPMNCARP